VASLPLVLETCTIDDRDEIEDLLRNLRCYDNRVFGGPGRIALDSVLDCLSITVDPGPTDYWMGSGIPLRTALSLLDADYLRQRVGQIAIHAPRSMQASGA
jgi:hypothetical protein